MQRYICKFVDKEVRGIALSCVGTTLQAMDKAERDRLQAKAGE